VSERGKGVEREGVCSGKGEGKREGGGVPTIYAGLFAANPPHQTAIACLPSEPPCGLEKKIDGGAFERTGEESKGKQEI
jgi:hypothetical protein